MALTKVGRLVDKGIVKDQTNLGTEAADTDEFLLYDASADALKAIQSQNVLGPGIITNKTELGLADLTTSDILLIYDASAGALKKITKGNLVASQPVITSVSPTNALSGDGTGNYNFTLTGSGFENATVKFIGNDATEYTADTTTTDSAGQVTAVIAKSSLPVANEPYDIKVTNANTLTTTSEDAFNIDAQPVYSTASGSLGTFSDKNRTGISVSVVAADPESGGDITYTLESGSLPSGLSLTSTSSGGVISGNASAVGSNTTSTFTIRAADANSNTTDRSFSITINAPAVSTFTSSGTFSVPSGISAVDVLVVGAGGRGGDDSGGGGGAGGLIYRPSFPVTPGGTVTVTVGCGGATKGQAGQDSAFGTLTAKGGGYGSTYPTASNPHGGQGGSGGGGAGNPSDPTGPGGSATQPTQSGESGNYGFGTNGGYGRHNPGYWVFGGGGGGAQSQGHNISYNTDGDIPMDEVGYGGQGKSYSISGSAVYYAGGGGGGGGPFNRVTTTGTFTSRTKIPGGGTPSTPSGGGGFGRISGSPETDSGAGTANRGGGGGGGSHGGSCTPGGTGGKGVVIVSY